MQKLARPCLKNKLAWWCTPVIPATLEAEVGGSWFEAKLGIKALSEKQTESKRMGGVVQVVEYLPTKCKALCPIPNTTKKKRRRRRKLTNSERVRTFELPRSIINA
jgi:hypothetical protein